MYIEFKRDAGPDYHDGLAEQWESGNLHQGLVVVVLYAARLHFLLEKSRLVITSIYRPHTTDSGIHADWRAVDCRTRNMSPEHKKVFEDTINNAFPYWYGRSGSQTALVHEVRGEDGLSKGEHLHLQIGPGEPQPLQES